MKIRTRPFAAFLPLAAILLLPAIVSAQPFTEHNLFVAGNMTASGSDVEGSLAVGGNLNLNTYSVGLVRPAWNGTSNTITVGGSMTLTQTAIYRGNARSVGPATTSFVSFEGGGSAAGFTTSLINFASLDVSYGALSANLTTLSGGGTLTNVAGALTLNAGGGLNTYSLSSSSLSAINSITINGSSDATVLVNVTGTSPSMQNMAFTLSGGITASRVLFNFPAATTLTVSGIGIRGSILAPNASMNFNNGAIYGQGAVQTFSGNGQWYSAPFTGTLAVPAPSAAAVSLLAIGAAARRRRSRC